MRVHSKIRAIAAFAVLSVTACAPEGNEIKIDTATSEDGKTDSSVEASFLVFEFDGELTYTSSWQSKEDLINDQFLYTIGQLNGNRAVGRLDNLELSDIKSSALSGGGTRVTYHAKLPVAWGAKTNLPTSYTFKLPRNVSDFSGFTAKYKDSCAESAPHEIDTGSMWYYYRPSESGCTLAAADIVEMKATVRPSTHVTTGKYPEYNKVWEDGELRVVAIFGKYEKTGTTSSDAGIAAYNEFISKVRALGTMTTIPADVPTAPGIANPDIEFTLSLAGGKKLVVNALLVDEIASASSTFYNRYDALSKRADLIAYNGHAGLGQNIRALAQHGSWTSGQYLILFSNGCDTYAYVDGSLADARRSINPDDPTGTKYLDFVVNAMPAFFHEDADASMVLIKGLLKYDAPQTYETMFQSFDRSQVVLVTGEEDNAYTPSSGGDSGGTWAGLNERADVAQGEELQFSTGEVPAGTYVVTLAPDGADGGDADLFVRVGAKPTASQYDCRPYENGSNESCTVTLASKATIYISVNGYSKAAFILTAKKQGGGSPGPAWAGLDESFTIAKSAQKRWEASSLPAGRYAFTISGDGDADLYVKLGTAPTTSSYDCRPYANGSAEECTVTLNETKTVHVMVRGYAATSKVRLVGKKL